MKFKNLALVGLVLLIFLVLAEGVHHKLSRYQHKKRAHRQSEVTEEQVSNDSNDFQEERNDEGSKEKGPKEINYESVTTEGAISNLKESRNNSLLDAPKTNASAINSAVGLNVNLSKESKPTSSDKGKETVKENMLEADQTVSDAKVEEKSDSDTSDMTNLNSEAAVDKSGASTSKKLNSSLLVNSSQNATSSNSSDQNSSSSLAASGDSNKTESGSSNSSQENQNKSQTPPEGEIHSQSPKFSRARNDSENATSAASSSANSTSVANASENASSAVRDNNSTGPEMLIDKDGNKYERVEYIKNLSPYAKEELAVMRDPSRASSFMIGKPFYIENNMTFNETPKIFSDVIDSKIWDTTRTKRDMTQYELWKNFESKSMNEVAFKRDNGEEEFEGNIIKTPEATKFEDVEIKLIKNSSAAASKQEGDPALEEVFNPLKRQLFETQETHSVTYDKKVLDGVEKSVEDTGAVVGVHETKAPPPKEASVIVTPKNKRH